MLVSWDQGDPSAGGAAPSRGGELTWVLTGRSSLGWSRALVLVLWVSGRSGALLDSCPHGHLPRRAPGSRGTAALRCSSPLCVSVFAEGLTH